MSNYADLDAQLAALQAQLRDEIQTNEEKVEWPETPDFDSLAIKEVQESTPTLAELEELSVSSDSSNKAKSSDNLSTPSESSKKAEEEVDQLADSLMTNLENGTLSDNVSDTKPIEKCHKCGKEIASFDAACSAMGHFYHITCLTCLKCGKALHGSEFIVMGTDDPYCQECYESTLEVCIVCNLPIKTRILRAAGEAYHPECFKCCNCSCPLDGVPFTQDDAKKSYCIKCYQDLYSPKCEKCQKPIAPEPGQQEALRIIALEKSFHKGCFTCKSCDLSLSDKDSGGCYPVDSELFCKRCSVVAINSRSG